ncbi:MAG: hypothetical protein Q7U28_04350 [Aquabacterium sp.]|nr:hypothetical protein [Aquabacterium sp.]
MKKSLEALSDNDPHTFRQAMAFFSADFSRLVSWLHGGAAHHRVYWFLLPTVQVLFWFRLARWLYLIGWRNAARVLCLFNQYITGIEIPPTSSIGPGCVISHAEGIVICGRVGARCTLSGSGGIGGGARAGDVGGGPGLPWVGDDVLFGQGAGVFGAVRIGSNVLLGVNSLTLDNVPDGATVIAPVANEDRGPSPNPDAVHPTASHTPGEGLTTMYDTPLSFARTRTLIASDARRLFQANGGGGLGQRIFWTLLPSFQALFWYRLSRYCFLRGWRTTARVIFLFSLYRTRVEIPPTTYIGEACLIAHASGIVLYGAIGDRATMYGDAKIGGGIDNSVNIGAGPGYPILGDDVVMGYRASVLGPYRIGNGARMGPYALALFDVPPGAKMTTRKSVVMQSSPPATPPPEASHAIKS